MKLHYLSLFLFSHTRAFKIETQILKKFNHIVLDHTIIEMRLNYDISLI